jgi:hypothetical protein
MRGVIVNARLLALLAGAACVLAGAMPPITAAAEATATPSTDQPIEVAAQQPIAAEPPLVVAADLPAGAAPRPTAAAQQWPIFQAEQPSRRVRKAVRIAPAAKKRAALAPIRVSSRADLLLGHRSSYALIGVGFGF